MSWKDMKISQKLSIGFGLLILLLVTTGIISFIGIDDIVDNADEVIQGNKLNTMLAQNEVYHLSWAGQVNALITDETVTSIDVETDDHKCGLGRWLYGEERQNAEKLVPSLKPLLKGVEEPHKRLHKSAVAVQEVFKQPHPGLALTLSDHLNDHVQWVTDLSARLLEEANGVHVYQSQAKGIVDSALSIVEAIEEGADDAYGARDQAIQVLSAMRYGPDDQNFLWVTDLTPRMVMHPYNTALEGRDLSHFTDPGNRKPFTELQKACMEFGEGFTTYLQPLPGGDRPLPKISYAKLYKNWSWIIGTGVYIDPAKGNLFNRAKASAAGEPFRFHQEMDPARCGLGKFLADPRTLEIAGSFPELSASLEAIGAPHRALHESAEQIADLINRDKFPEAMSVFEKQTMPLFKEVKGHLADAIAAESRLQQGADKAVEIYATQTIPALQSVQKALVEIRSEAQNHILTDKAMIDSAKQTRRYVFVIVVLAVFIGIFMTYVITNVLKRPILKSVEFARAIAAGDLTGTIDISQKDEVGVLVQSLKEMAANLRDILNNLVDTTSSLSGASEELSAVSSQMAASSEEMSAQAGSVGAASEQVTASVSTVAAASEQSSASVSSIAVMTEEMSATFTNVAQSSYQTAENVGQMAQAADSISSGINTVAAAVEEMTVSLNEVAKNTAQASMVSQNANQRAGEINTKMDALVNASKQIGKIVSVIKDIADQTNMLALNATIEAASAGESGKGFAVVAGEVKELARQSADATDEIAGQIDRIQSSTNEAVNAITEVNKIILEISDINQEIASSVEEQTATASEISKSVATNAATVEDVAKRARDSAELVDEIARSTSEASKTASSVAHHVDELSKGVKDVARSANEGAIGVQDISRSLQNINMAAKETAMGAEQTLESSQELAKMAEALSRIVAGFKL
jgi:methyl-accepting chemotaxis protein